MVKREKSRYKAKTLVIVTIRGRKDKDRDGREFCFLIVQDTLHVRKK